MEQTDLALDVPFLNEDPEHRQALIAVLKAHGLEAHEYGSGGGFNHVCVYLVAEEQDWLAIATGKAIVRSVCSGTGSSTKLEMILTSIRSH